MDIAGLQQIAGEQQRGEQGADAEEEMQSIQKWTGLFAMRPEQQSVAAYIQDPGGKPVDEHGKQQQAQRL